MWRASTFVMLRARCVVYASTIKQSQPPLWRPRSAPFAPRRAVPWPRPRRHTAERCAPKLGCCETPQQPLLLLLRAALNSTDSTRPTRPKSTLWTHAEASPAPSVALNRSSFKLPTSTAVLVFLLSKCTLHMRNACRTPSRYFKFLALIYQKL